MKRLVIVRRGSCKRCGQCCDKSKAQPLKWAAAEKTEDPEYRIFNTTKGKRFNPRVCESLCDYGPGIGHRCLIYDKRPPVCQNFPEHPRDQMELDNCGYYFTIEWREEDD